MENEIQSNDTSTLSTQASICIPPLTNRSQILLFILLGIIIIFWSVFIGIQIGKNQSFGQKPITVQLTASPTQTGQMTIIGVIRTSGLSENEKQELGLSDVAYQLTDFNKNDKQDIYGYYLISNDKTIETLLGKCVQMTGSEPTEWKSRNKGNSYLRTAFVPNNIYRVESSKCSPYSVTASENIAGTEKLILQGIANNNNRPAPDINYDYQVKLTKPFLDKNSSSGSPQQVSLVDVVPDTNNVWIELTNNINHEVEIQGYMEWGYAESKYFRITSIKSIQ